MIIKKIFITLGVFIFFSFIWFMQNKDTIHVPTFENLLWMNNTAYGYNSILALCVFYTIPFIIYFNLLFIPDRNVATVRGIKRNNLYIKILAKILVTSLFFSLIHMVVSLIFTYIFIDWSTLADSQFLIASLYNMLGVTLFYFSVGITYRGIYDLKNSSGIATLLTYLSIATMFFVSKLILPLEMWSPVRDLVILSYMLEEKISSSGILFIYLKQIMSVILLYLIGSWLYIRKDFI